MMENSELLEKKQHGTALRPFANYTMEICDEMMGYPMHWHEETEVIRVQRGRGVVFIDGKRLEVEKGDILIVNPYLLHAIGRLDEESMLIESVVFNIHMLESSMADACTVKFLAPISNRTHLCRNIIRPSDENYQVFNQNMTTLLMACNDKQEGYELAVKANLMWLFYHLYNKGMIRKKTVEDEEKYSDVLKTAIEYIRKHIGDVISISDIATECGYSEAYMMKIFKRMTGATCVEYINAYRLKLCAEKLLNTNEKVLEIAYSVGFNNISYFNLQFKKVYGMTPKEYRSMKNS